MIRQAAKWLSAAVVATVAALCAASAAPLAVAVTPAAITAPLPSAPAAPVPSATDARIIGDKDRTRFVLDLSDTVQPTVFPLADPYRLVIDVAAVNFALPKGTGQTGRGLISAFRYGQFSPGKSRIVIDLTGPATVAQTYVTPAAAGQPARLVVEIAPATRQQFLAATAQYRDTAGSSAAAARGITGSIPASPKLGAKPVVVLDPGHGGIDLGAVGKSGTQEKNVALAVAKALADKLTATGRYDVYLTRTDDSFVALGDRVQFAQAHNADLLISIHANSYSLSSVRGAAVYTFCEQMCDTDASRMALSENQSDALAGLDVAAADASDVRNILTDLTRRETLNFAQVFAMNLVKDLKTSDTLLFKEPHQEANFKVLTAADVPSALVELGFITNPTDEKLMTSPDWQASTAATMTRAVADYFASRLAPASGNAEVVAETPR